LIDHIYGQINNIADRILNNLSVVINTFPMEDRNILMIYAYKTIADIMYSIFYNELKDIPFGNVLQEVGLINFVNIGDLLK